MEGKIRKKLIAVGGYPFASLHPLEGAAAQLSSHRRVGDFWRPAFRRLMTVKKRSGLSSEKRVNRVPAVNASPKATGRIKVIL